MPRRRSSKATWLKKSRSPAVGKPGMATNICSRAELPSRKVGPGSARQQEGRSHQVSVASVSSACEKIISRPSMERESGGNER